MPLFFFYILMNSIEQKGEGNVKRTTRLEKKSIGYGVGIGVAVSVVISVLLLCLLSCLMIKQRLSEHTAGIAVFIIRFLAINLGTLIGSKLTKENGVIVIAAITTAYLVILLGLGIVAYEGVFRNFGTGLFSVLIGAGVSTAIVLKPQRKSKRTIKYKH